MTIGDYEIVKTLGTGSFGKVKREFAARQAVGSTSGARAAREGWERWDCGPHRQGSEDGEQSRAWARCRWEAHSLDAALRPSG